MSDRVTGSVKWFNNAKGYGFLLLDDGSDVFVHYNNIRGEGYRTLPREAKVEFTLIKGDKGLQAEDVVVIEEGA